MKKKIFVTLFFICLSLLSCSKKDDLTNSDINGTIWISNNIGTTATPIYEKLNFMFNGAFYVYESMPNSTEHSIVWGGLMVWGGLYDIKGNQITFTSPLEANTGTINGNTINIVMLGYSMIFTKQ